MAFFEAVFEERRVKRHMRHTSHVNVAERRGQGPRFIKIRGVSHEGAYDVQRVFSSNQSRRNFGCLIYPWRRGLARGCNIANFAMTRGVAVERVDGRLGNGHAKEP